MPNYRKLAKDETIHRGNQSRVCERLCKTEKSASSETNNNNAHWWETGAYLAMSLAFEGSDYANVKYEDDTSMHEIKNDDIDELDHSANSDIGLEDALLDNLWF